MESRRGQSAKPRNLSRTFELLSNALRRHQKTHDYTHYQASVDYVFEPINHGAAGYMTGQGRGFRRGDRLILLINGVKAEYQIETIDYYSSPDTTWIALLTKAR